MDFTPASQNGVVPVTELGSLQSKFALAVSSTSTIIGQTLVVKAISNAAMYKTVPVTFYCQWTGTSTTAVLGTSSFYNTTTAALVTADLNTGTNYLWAEWPGEGLFAAQSTVDAPVTVLVDDGVPLGGAIDIVILPSSGNLVVGEGTATIYASLTTSTNVVGNLRFYVDNVYIGRSALLANQAIIQVDNLAAGTRTIQVEWPGGDLDGTRYEGKFDSTTYEVLRGTSVGGNLVLTTSKNRAISGEGQLTFTANITTSTSLPGRITFYQGTESLGYGDVVGNSATITVNNLFPTGYIPFTAQWDGNQSSHPRYIEKTSNTATITIAEKETIPSMTLTVSPASAVRNSGNVTMTATANTSTPVTGLVKFYSGATLFDSTNFVNNVATVNVPTTFAAGTYTVYAFFVGSDSSPKYYPVTSNSATLTVINGFDIGSNLVLSASQPQVIDEPIRLTAKLTTSTITSSTVVFYQNNLPFANAEMSSTGTAFTTTTLSSTGSVVYKAYWVGGTMSNGLPYVGKLSNTTTVNVVLADTLGGSFTIASSDNTEVVSNPITLRATLNTSTVVTGTTGGAVTFYVTTASLQYTNYSVLYDVTPSSISKDSNGVYDNLRFTSTTTLDRILTTQVSTLETLGDRLDILFNGTSYDNRTYDYLPITVTSLQTRVDGNGQPYQQQNSLGIQALSTATLTGLGLTYATTYFNRPNTDFQLNQPSPFGSSEFYLYYDGIPLMDINGIRQPKFRLVRKSPIEGYTSEWILESFAYLINPNVQTPGEGWSRFYLVTPGSVGEYQLPENWQSRRWTARVASVDTRYNNYNDIYYKMTNVGGINRIEVWDTSSSTQYGQTSTTIVKPGILNNWLNLTTGTVQLKVTSRVLSTGTIANPTYSVLTSPTTGNRVLGTSTFVNNTASITLAAGVLNTGSYQIYAEWAGKSVAPKLFGKTSNTLQQDVSSRQTANITVAYSQSPYRYYNTNTQQNTGLTATIYASGAFGPATGGVEVLDVTDVNNPIPLGIVPFAATTGTTATATVSWNPNALNQLPEQTRNLKFNYQGDAYYYASTVSDSLSIIGAGVAAVVSVNANTPNRITGGTYANQILGNTVNLQATFANSQFAPSFVNFQIVGGDSLGTATVVNGVAELNAVNFGGYGTYTVKVSYTPTLFYKDSNNLAVTLRSTLALPITMLTPTEATFDNPSHTRQITLTGSSPIWCAARTDRNSGSGIVVKFSVPDVRYLPDSIRNSLTLSPKPTTAAEHNVNAATWNISGTFTDNLTQNYIALRQNNLLVDGTITYVMSPIFNQGDGDQSYIGFWLEITGTGITGRNTNVNSSSGKGIFRVSRNLD